MGTVKPVIVAVGYNRVAPFRRLLHALENSNYTDKDITLVISIDNSGKNDVIDMANDFQWTHGEKIIRTYEENQGLKKHLIQCGDLSIEYGAAIIFEDDIVPAPFFYDYVCQALEFYESDDRIIAISLYSQRWNIYVNRVFEPVNSGFDAYISQVACSWGECFVGKQWKEFRKWYNENDNKLQASNLLPHAVYGWDKSWCKYLLHYLVHFDKYFVTPYVSLATNFNDAGTHMLSSSCVFQQPILTGRKEFRFPKYEEAVKYDAFSENKDLQEQLEKKYKKKVCIDYFGSRDNREDFDLCLSSVNMPYEKVTTYGLELKPYELNVQMNVAGEDLYLYDLHKPTGKRKDWRHHYHIVQYDVKALGEREALFYYLYHTYLKFTGKS